MAKKALSQMPSIVILDEPQQNIYPLASIAKNTDKIYVVGGYWYYEGENKEDIKETLDDDTTYYAFWKVPYHEIDFSNLTKI